MGAARAKCARRWTKKAESDSEILIEVLMTG
jgi:hypothetical protein